MDVRTCARSSAPRAHIRTSKSDSRMHRTHISEKNSAPICTEIAAPARVRVCACTHTKGLQFRSTFLKAHHYTNFKDSIIFSKFQFLSKNLSNFVPTT